MLSPLFLVTSHAMLVGIAAEGGVSLGDVAWLRSDVTRGAGDVTSDADRNRRSVVMCLLGGF